MSKLSALKDLQSATGTAPAAPVEGAAPAAAAPVKEKAKKEDKPKRTPEELKELRRKNLKPKERDPKKVEEDEKLEAAIRQLIAQTPAGLTSSQLREAIYTAGAEKAEQKAQEKRIRFMCRDIGCERKTIENNRKLYFNPKPKA